MFKKLIAIILNATIFATLLQAFAANVSAVSEIDIGLSNKPGTYNAYLESLNIETRNYPIDSIRINAVGYAAESNLSIDTVADKQGVLLEKIGDILTVPFTVNETGFYSIGLTYCALPDNGSDIEFTMKIDNELLFDGMEKLTVTRLFSLPSEEFDTDNRGNQLRPTQQEVTVWQNTAIEDSEGIVGEPYAFYFTAGKHKISFALQREKVAISEICIYNDADLAGYTKPQDLTENNAEPIVIEAEHPDYTSSSMLYPISDRSDPNTTPCDPTLVRLNSIGGDNWVYPSQRIKWSFQIKTAGYYAIGLRYLQNFQSGMCTYRRIKIDNEYPFAEMTAQGFKYNAKWQRTVIGDGKEPYYFYFEPGPHTIEMSVTTDGTADLIDEVDNAVYMLNEMYRKIIMVTGTSPDIYRDYYLDEMIPGLMDEIQLISDALKICENNFENAIGVKGGEAATLQTVYYQLDDFIKSPNTIPSRLSTFETNISSLATWVMDIREQPLKIDKIFIYGYGQEAPRDEYRFFGKLCFSVRSFLLSFVTDYSSVGNVYDEDEAITVWVNTGRDQSEVIKSMIDSEFTPNHSVSVNFSIVQDNLMQAIMADKGPDVALFVGRGQPVNMALREAIEPLNQFSDFDEATSEYSETDLIPYYLNGNCYALPESKSFYMMFYRTDVFSDLSIEPPNTWDDLYSVAEVLQRNNMNVGLPYSSMDAYSVVDAGLGSTSIFPTLLLQKGVRFYNDELNATNLSGEIGYKTFKMWTEFYTLYGFPVIKSDFNRFRTGEMPITIAKYTFYNQLYVAAPEIRNLWKMVAIPATVSENGTLNRNQVGSGTACVMIRGAKNKENSWEFMKWWTESDTQGSYGRQVESILGAAARYNPIKASALSQIPWSGAELEMLINQFDSIYEIEEIPGGYYSSRNIDNAFKEVVYNNKNPRETLKYWNEKTDDEILRKRREFGLE